MIVVVISLYLFNGGSHASDTSTCLNGSLNLIMYNVTHMYLPNKRSSLLLHSRISLIECVSEANHCIREYIFVFATLYSRYESYSSLSVFVPALMNTDIVFDQNMGSRVYRRLEWTQPQA